jgi:FkbM family methyltransferase
MLKRYIHALRRRLRRSLLPRNDWVEVERQGIMWRLCTSIYMDRSILEKGCFEERTTKIAKEFVKKGMKVIDVGANIGYYTLLFAKLIGPTGRVWAFEPVTEYRQRLIQHLERNGLSEQVCLSPYGLSDREQELSVSIGECSATLHPVVFSKESRTERIVVKRLDDVSDELGIKGADFVKVDVDGHEPFFLKGAKRFITQHMPVMVIEFSQLNLDRSNLNVIDQCRQLEDLGYVLVSEKTGKPFGSRVEFLQECGNYTHTANVWAYPRNSIKPDFPGRLT